MTKSGTSTERKTLENQGPMRTNGAGLPFKQAVGSGHRAVVDIKVHVEMAARGSALGNRLRKALGAALNAECAADRKDNHLGEGAVGLTGNQPLCSFSAAVGSLCMAASDAGPAYARRMVALLVDGLRHGASPS